MDNPVIYEYLRDTMSQPARVRSLRTSGRFARLVASRFVPVQLAIALYALAGLAMPAEAQTRSPREGAGSSGSATSNPADTSVMASGAEEPTDLAFGTINGQNTSPASRARSLSAPPHLSQAELRVLDNRRRNTESLVPLRGYPTTERSSVPNRPGYADGSFGLHATARLRAGYSGSSWPFDYYGSLAFDMSDGYSDDNAMRALSVGAGAGYIIDEGYGMFSGGHMGADVRYDNNRYHLYALASSPVRSSDNWSVGTSGANTWAGVSYEAAARFRSLGIDDDSLTSRETSLDGMLSLSTTWQGLAIGAQTDLRLTNLDGGSISFGRIEGFGSYSNRFMTARAGVQFSAGANSDGTTSGTIAPTGELRLFPLHGLTLIGTVTGGLSPTSLAALSRVNPYIALAPTVRQLRENVGYQIHARIEPSRAFALRATAARSHYNDYAYFDSLRDGRFQAQYGGAIVNRIIGDLTWRMDEINSIVASAEFTEGLIDDRRALMFTPKWVADLLYTRRLSGIPLEIDAGARYIGTRPSSGGRSLEQVVLLNLGGRYAVATRLDLTLEVRNLLDASYQLWEGYDERGIFAAVGVSARF